MRECRVPQRLGEHLRGGSPETAGKSYQVYGLRDLFQPSEGADVLSAFAVGEVAFYTQSQERFMGYQSPRSSWQYSEKKSPLSKRHSRKSRHQMG